MGMATFVRPFLVLGWQKPFFNAGRVEWKQSQLSDRITVPIVTTPSME